MKIHKMLFRMLLVLMFFTFQAFSNNYIYPSYNHNNNTSNKKQLMQNNDHHNYLSLEYQIYFLGRASLGIVTDEIIHLDTYREYVDHFKENDIYQDIFSYEPNWGNIINDGKPIIILRQPIYYKEEFFKNNGLILFKKIERSGSNQVKVDCVKLTKEYILLIFVDIFRPVIGPCDIAQHYYLIEYKKHTNEIKEIRVKLNVNKK